MKWTKEVPTAKGDYLWRENDICIAIHIEIEESGLTRCAHWPSQMRGEWCRLVPADEVEKAFEEGYMADDDWGTLNEKYETSRAKRVAEGKEEQV